MVKPERWLRGQAPLHGVVTAFFGLSAVVLYAISLNGSMDFLPSFGAYNDAEGFARNITMIGIIVSGVWPAVFAAYAARESDAGTVNASLISFLGFAALVGLLVVEGEADAGVDPFRLIMVVWLGGMALRQEATLVVISGTLLVANDRYFYGCAVPLAWGIAVAFKFPPGSTNVPYYCYPIRNRVRFLGVSATAAGVRRCVYLWYRGGPTTICQVHTMQTEDGLVQSTMIFLWACSVLFNTGREGVNQPPPGEPEGEKKRDSVKNIRKDGNFNLFSIPVERRAGHTNGKEL